METTLNQCTQDCCKKVFSTQLCWEETMESVVPDVLPDISQILHTDGFALLRSKEVDADRITIGASVPASVLYCPEDGSAVRRLGLTVPVTVTVDAPGVTEESIPVTTVRLVSLDTRLLNPRKVLVRAEVLVSVDCYEHGQLCFCDRIAENGGDIQLLPDRVSHTPIRLVREKTFVLTDRCSVAPSQPPVGDVLSYQVSLLSEECKFVGPKCMLKGVVRTVLLYAAAESGALHAAEFETGFSQLLDLEDAGDSVQAQVSLMLTGAFLEPLGTQDQREISLELHLVAQTVCSARSESVYLQDAYSNSCMLSLTRTRQTLSELRRRVCLRETVRTLIETPQPVRELAHATCRVGTATVCDGRISCPVLVSCLYRGQEGSLGSVSRQLRAETTAELGEQLQAELLEVCPCQLQAAATPAGIELRIPVEFLVNAVEHHTIEPITGIDMGQPCDAQPPRPSVTLVTAQPNDTLWALAKRHASTVAQIEAANALEQDADIAGRLLLIPGIR